MSTAAFSFANLELLERQLAASPALDAEICASYVLLHLYHRHGTQWLSGPRHFKSAGASETLVRELERLEFAITANQRRKLAGLRTLHELYSHFYFRGVVLDSHEGILGWLDQRYPLRLRLDIPSPQEMLEIQCLGQRWVTLHCGANVQFRAYGRHRDACTFLLHDFEHAHKFFASGESHRGQVRFFRALKSSGAFFDRWTGDPGFVRDLDYLKSDMNSHPVHLMKYLKAVILSAEMRRSGHRWPELNGYFSDLFKKWGMSDLALNAALKINHPEMETRAEQLLVSQFFMPLENLA